MRRLKLGFCLTVWVVSSPLAAADLESRVEEAIDRGVAFLHGEMKNAPWWGRRDAPRRGRRGGPRPRGRQRYLMGRSAIEIYALLASDFPVDDPTIREGLEFLEELEPGWVYGVSLYLMALDSAWTQTKTVHELLQACLSPKGLKSREARAWRKRKKEDEKGHAKRIHDLRKRMQEVTTWLVNAMQPGRGAWNYVEYGSQDRYDNSNTQFAVLGLAVSAKRKIPIEAEVWKQIADHFLKDQQANGPPARESELPDSKRRTQVGPIRMRGWCYQARGRPTLNMTAAGLSSLIIAKMFGGAEFPQTLRRQIDQAIWDGLAHLASTRLNYAKWPYYGLYSVEKVGDSGNIQKIGELDWYRHGAERLLREQKADGSWGDQNQRQAIRYQTAFALLFLNRATSDALYTQVGNRPGFIKALKREISLARFFRRLRYQIAYQGSPDLLPAAELILAQADVGELPKLVPYAIGLAESPETRLYEFAVRCLQKVTGLKHEDLEKYRSWLSVWREADRTGQERDKSGVEKLVKHLQTTQSLTLKRHILWALERTLAREAIGVLIDELEDRNRDYRDRVYGALKYISGQSFPFDAKAPLTTRRRQIEHWRQWHATRSGDS